MGLDWTILGIFLVRSVLTVTVEVAIFSDVAGVGIGVVGIELFTVVAGVGK